MIGNRNYLNLLKLARKTSWNHFMWNHFRQIWAISIHRVLQSEPSLQWLRGCCLVLLDGIAHQKKKRESCHSTDEKVQTFFFRFSSDASSEPTHSISSFFYFFFSMLAASVAAAARHCTACVWNDIIFSISFTCARELTPFYTAAAAVNAPSPRRPLSLWIVHGERFFIRKKNSIYYLGI